MEELRRSGLLQPKNPSQGGEGRPVTEADGFQVESVEERPLASGAIAQVHLAKCRGETVILKVRHPRVGEEMLLDFELMRNAASFIHSWIPAIRWLNAPGTVSQFEMAMAGQCDLSQEAEHLRLFRENFRRKAGWIAFPRALYATPSVLVESFEDGELMSEFVASHQGVQLQDDVREQAHFVIARGEDLYLQMLLVDNFMHADLHPGNIMYRAVGPRGKPQIVILDAGMAMHLLDSERRNFIGLLQGIGDGDGRAVAHRVLCFSEKGMLLHGTHTAAAFTDAVEAMCKESCRGYGTGIDPGGVVRELMQLMYWHSIPIDGNYATMITNMLCLEGMAIALEPRFNVVDVAFPMLRAHQILGDVAFQKIFRWTQWLIPTYLWECNYRLSMYAALNGQKLKRFQI